MRCRTHSSDPGAGVCAGCLRERLSALESDSAEHDVSPSPVIRQRPELSPVPPAFICSRSVFPNNSNLSQASTPCSDGRKRRAVKFPFLSPILGNRSSNKVETDAIALKPSISNSRFLTRVLRHWKKNKKKSPQISPAADDAARGRSRKPHVRPVNGRGMSPASKDVTEEDERCLSTPSRLRQKAQRQQSPHRLTSYALCIRPMLRPSLGNRRNLVTSETIFTGDPRGTFSRRASGVGVAFPDTSFARMPNRSRKLVDLGKSW